MKERGDRHSALKIKDEQGHEYSDPAYQIDEQNYRAKYSKSDLRGSMKIDKYSSVEDVGTPAELPTRLDPSLACGMHGHPYDFLAQKKESLKKARLAQKQRKA